MSDILLTHGFFLDEDSGEQELMKPYPPLGLLYLSAHLKAAGLSPEVLDSTFAGRQRLLERLSRPEAGVLGLYATHMTRASVVQIIDAARERGWTVVLGGPDASCHPERYLERGAQVVLVGEGEGPLARLLPALASGGPHRLHEVPAAVFYDEQGAVVRNPPGPQLAAEQIGAPDRGAIDLELYLRAWRERHGRASLNVSFARGCPYGCRWCTRAVFGRTHRQRPAAACADELQSLVERYAPEQLYLVDDVFTLDHGWLHQLNRELDRRRIRVPFETISRADRLDDPQVMQALAEMGCFKLWIGSESGSDRVLQAMNRGVTAAQIQRAVHSARQHGIATGLFLMWGYEGEELEDIEATVEHIKLAGPDEFFSTVVYPIRGTPYHEQVRDRIQGPLDWSAASEKDNQVRGRPGREYYRWASRLLRAEVRAHQLRGDGPQAADEARAEADEARRELYRLHPSASSPGA